MDTAIIHSGNSLKIHRFLKSGPQPFFSQQGAKKIIVTACHLCKLKLPFTSPDVIWTIPKNFLTSWIDFTVLPCYLNSSKKITCLLGKLKTEFTSVIAKSTSPGLLDSSFFARWSVWLSIRWTCMLCTVVCAKILNEIFLHINELLLQYNFFKNC